jgi:hypothetical protein
MSFSSSDPWAQFEVRVHSTPQTGTIRIAWHCESCGADSNQPSNGRAAVLFTEVEALVGSYRTHLQRSHPHIKPLCGWRATNGDSCVLPYHTDGLHEVHYYIAGDE